MAQQPNIELDLADHPRRPLDTAPPRAWNVGSKPGVITAPRDMPSGGAFGTPGPDTGWALRIIRTLDPQVDPDLEAVLAALMAARASVNGRAPIPQDLEVAKLLCGMSEAAPASLVERRRRWLGAVPHERSKGRMAVSEVDRGLLATDPEAIRASLGL